jgi:hypothetical protein
LRIFGIHSYILPIQKNNNQNNCYVKELWKLRAYTKNSRFI